MLKYLIPLVIFLSLVILFFFGLKNDPKIVPSPFIDKQLPEINLPILSNLDELVSSRDFKGETFLLNVWATWCIPCRQEHSLLVELATDNAIKIIGLNYKDNNQEAQKWLQTLGNPYDLVMVDENGVAGIDLGVYGVPETFVIDSNLIVKYKHIGPLTENDITDFVIPLIDEMREK